jgi:hypothetical protein
MEGIGVWPTHKISRGAPYDSTNMWFEAYFSHAVFEYFFHVLLSEHRRIIHNASSTMA